MCSCSSSRVFSACPGDLKEFQCITVLADTQAFVLLLYPSQGHGEAAYGCRQGPPLDESPAHRRAQCEHLWVWYLAQGYLSSVLKVKMFWRLSLPKLLTSCVCIGSYAENPPLLSPVLSRVSYSHPVAGCFYSFIFLTSISVLISTLFYFGLTLVKQVSNLISTPQIYSRTKSSLAHLNEELCVK